MTKSMCFKPIQVILRGAFVFYNYCGLWGGGVGKQRPWSNSLIIKDLAVSYTFLASRSHFKPISSDFEGGLHFLHLGGGGGGRGCRKGRPTLNSLIPQRILSPTHLSGL